MICNVIILPVSYFGAYPLIRQFGMQGGSISLAVSYLIEIVALWIWLLRKVRQRRNNIWKNKKSACFRHFFDRKKSILEAKV